MSKSVLIGVISFIGGAVIGGFAAYKYATVKNEADLEKRAEAIKEQLIATYGRNKTGFVNISADDSCDAELIHVQPLKPEKTSYDVSSKDYSKYQKIVDQYKSKNEQKVETNSTELEPMFEIVDSDNLDEDWDVLGFTLYADGVVTDENDDPVDDVEAHLGSALEFFDCDSHLAMYVKNNNLNTYYEVSYDEYTYSESHVDSRG